MQGIILTGGKGTRLKPLTDNTNKHLLDLCGRPMIDYSLSILVSAGIEDVTLVTNPEHVEDFRAALESPLGRQFKRLRFIPQKDKPGIAGSIQMMPEQVRQGPYMVVLGDNIVGGSVHDARGQFEHDPEKALILLSEVPSPEAFGVVRIEDGRIVAIEEKPDRTDSRWVITGIYFFPTDLFNIAAGVRPSSRGEYEVTDILATYHRQNRLTYRILEHWWIDAGTHESLAMAKKMICGGSIPVAE